MTLALVQSGALDAEFDAIVAMLSEAGLIEVYVNDEGREAYRLTPKGAQLGRAMALSGEDADAEAMLDALLDSRER